MTGAKFDPNHLRTQRRRARHGCWDHLIVAEDATPLARLAPARTSSVLLLGHEHSGIPDAVLVGVDECVAIPMIGWGARLNVAVAGSLVAYRLAGLS